MVSTVCFLFGAYLNTNEQTLKIIDANAMIFRCRSVPLTPNPSGSPTVHPTDRPTYGPTKTPTYSPVLGSACVDVYGFSSCQNCTSEVFEYLLRPIDACCSCYQPPQFVGGIYELSTINIDSFASDLKYSTDFGLAFWVEILRDRYTLWNCATFRDLSDLDACAWVEDYRVNVRFKVDEGNETTTHILQSDELLFQTFYSVLISYDKQANVSDLTMFINGKSSNRRIFHTTAVIETPSRVYLSTGSNYMSDKLLYTRHPFAPAELGMLHERFKDTWPLRFPESLYLPIGIAGITSFLTVAGFLTARYKKIDYPDITILLSAGAGILDFASDLQLVYQLWIFPHWLAFYMIIFTVIPPLFTISYFIYWYLETLSTPSVVAGWIRTNGSSFVAILVLAAAIL